MIDKVDGQAEKIHEIKVVNDINSEKGKLKVGKPGRKAAFANSAPHLIASIRGAEKGHGTKRRKDKDAKYAPALLRGVNVLAIIFNVFGGMFTETEKEFKFMSKRKGEGLSEEERAQSTWASEAYTSFFGQKISIAINTQVARQVLDARRIGSRARPGPGKHSSGGDDAQHGAGHDHDDDDDAQHDAAEQERDDDFDLDSDLDSDLDEMETDAEEADATYPSHVP